MLRICGQLDQPELGMPSPDYFLYDDANSKLLVYKRFALKMAEALGAEAQTAKRDVDAMIDFEIQLAKVSANRDSQCILLYKL